MAARRRDPLSLGSHGLPSGSFAGNQQSASSGASGQSWSISPTSSWAPSPPWAVGVATQPQQPPSRSGSGTPAGQAGPSSNHWNRRDGRSVSVPPIVSGGSPQPVAFAPILPPAASSAAPPSAHTPSRLQAPPSGRPRLGSSPGRVLSSSGSRTIPSPSASGSFQHGFASAPSPSPSRLTVLPDSSPGPTPSSLPPVPSGFQRRHSSPQYSSDVEDLDEFGSPRKPSSARALAFSPEPPISAAAPIPAATLGRPDSADSLASWKRGTDRPKTSVAGRKPVYGVASMTGRYPGMVKENQDGYFVYEHNERADHVVAGVLDGHGVQGRQVSSFVKDHLGRKLVSNHRALPHRPASESLEQSFVETASALQGTGIDARQSGTTAVTLLRRGDELYIANVGDSRCVLAREDGAGIKAVPLSRDHKPDAHTERERIAKAGGFVEPTMIGSTFQGPHRVWRRRQVDGGLAISRSIGDTALEAAGVVPKPDVIKQTVTPADKFVVMASDGVWDQLTNEQVVAIASMHDDPRHASSAIVKEARRRWERDGSYVDDITALVLKM